MATEFDNIASLRPIPGGTLTGKEQIEAVSEKVAQAGGVPNALITVAQIAAYANGATGVQTIAAAAYTANKADANQYSRFTNAGPVIFTIPPVGDGTGGTVVWALGDELDFEQAGAGAVSPTAGAGVTINCRGGATKTAGQFAVASLKYVDVNTWTFTGDIA